jgi:hypothetical protein
MFLITAPFVDTERIVGEIQMGQTTTGTSMKIVLMLLFALAVLTANAQPTNATPALQTQLVNRLSKASSLALNEAKLNEVVKGNVTYSGLAVELARLDNPLQLLQLINPAAPAKYGSPKDNVLPDAYNGRNLGWKIFSLSF